MVTQSMKASCKLGMKSSNIVHHSIMLGQAIKGLLLRATV